MGRFSFWLGLTGLILGAVFGAIDLELLGGIVGGAVGLIAAALLGELIDLLVAPFRGGKQANTAGKWVGRVLALAFVVVFAHEVFWMLNFVSLAATHNIGARINRMVVRGEKPQTVQDNLKEKRWQVAVFAARPIRWFLLGDIHATARSTQDLVDDVIGGKVSVDGALDVRGKETAARTEDLLDRSIPRTWLLRFLPRSILIPKE
jgi:hypothetical protein